MTYPQEALDAAAAEVAWRTHGSRAANPDDIMFASRILGAAAPLIAAAERERILDALPNLAGSSIARIVRDAIGGQP